MYSVAHCLIMLCILVICFSVIADTANLALVILHFLRINPEREREDGKTIQTLPKKKNKEERDREGDNDEKEMIRVEKRGEK